MALWKRGRRYWTADHGCSYPSPALPAGFGAVRQTKWQEAIQLEPTHPERRWRASSVHSAPRRLSTLGDIFAAMRRPRTRSALRRIRRERLEVVKRYPETSALDPGTIERLLAEAPVDGASNRTVEHGRVGAAPRPQAIQAMAPTPPDDKMLTESEARRSGEC